MRIGGGGAPPHRVEPALVRRSIVVLAALVGLLASAPTVEAEPTTLELRSVEQLTPRLEQLRVYSPALQRESSVRVLTPAGFDPGRDQLPVLWLLHGGFGSDRDWTEMGNAEALTEGLPLIVVMPSNGTGGWYSDWRDVPAEGPMNWETYHLEELRPFIEARYGTRTDRGGRAVAGLSMGGFGAMHYASRHPDLFGFAAAFSGAVDSRNPAVSAVITASPFAHGGQPDDIYGARVVDEARWEANNPVDLAENLRHVEIVLRTRNGLPGGRYREGLDIVELGCWSATTSLHDRLDALGIAHTFEDRGPGAHTWPNWRDDLEATLPRIVEATSATNARPAPTTVEHVAYEPTFDAWGHEVDRIDGDHARTVLVVRPDGYDITGRGGATVTTPAGRYLPGQLVDATVGATTTTLVADDDGRTRLGIDLGDGSAPVRVVLTPQRNWV